MVETNANARLETFCDGVFAIAMTLLIIEIKPPPADTIHSTLEFWRALVHLGPGVFAFVLSFGVILITWVNHHGTLKLVHRSAASFIYANGFLLLTVVFIPFPTALLGEYIWTDHAAPAVVLYDAVLSAQALGWVLMSGSVLKHHLASDDRAASIIRTQGRNGYFACALYALLAIVAFWFPLTAAVVTSASWVFWLVFGIRLKNE